MSVAAGNPLLHLLQVGGARPDFEDAACKDAPPERFFPPGVNGRDVERHHRQVADYLDARYCSRCPVAAACLEYARSNYWMTGIWAGTTEFERRAERRSRIEAASSA